MTRISSALCALALTGFVGASVAHATPTDSGFPWSMGSLRVADLTQGSDNEVYATFKNPGGDVRKFWPNSSGADICFGQSTLRLARARTNFREIVETLQAAGLSGRTVWVAYEPTGTTCYIKSVSVSLQ